jgi:4-hydroxy-tetrahydrodipicolinate synthase
MTFEGIFTALITPFQSGGRGIDREAFHKLMNRQIAAGVDAVILGGSTGEGQTLEIEELDELLELGLAFKNKIKVLGACGSSSTSQTIERLKHIQKKKPHGILVSNPPYNKPPQRGLQKHFEAIADATEVPLIVYNIPGRTGINLAPATLQNLWSKPSIVSVKESSGSVEQMESILRSIPSGKTLLCGDDPLNLSIWALGGRGTVSVLSNVAPKALTEMWRLWKSGEIAQAQKIHHQVTPFIEALFCESNPIPVKFCMAEILKTPLAPRMPLVDLEVSHHARLRSEIKRLTELGWIEA